MKNNLSLLAIFALTLAVTPARANVKPNSLFSDNAVLQRGMSLPVWGTARDGEKVTVEFAGQKVSTTAKDGKWMVHLEPLKAGGPFTMTITGDNTVSIKNILIGEVWICSGQSNMQRPLGAVNWAPPVDNWQQEVAAANYPQIRAFSVPSRISFTPVADSDGNWTVCSPKTVPDYSAVGYFFGRDLYQDLHVPIGLVFSYWGGTVAEAWTSAGALKTMPAFQADLKQVQDVPAIERAKNNYAKILTEWYEKNDPGSKANAPWSDPALDDSGWQEMKLPTFWENAGMPGFDGVVWFRKDLNLPEAWAGQKAVLHLGPIDDDDTTWINGVQVGATAGYNIPRDYTIPASVLKSGRNVIAIRVLDTGGPGGIYGPTDQLKLEISGDHQAAPVSLADTWRYHASNSLAEAQPLPKQLNNNPNVVTVLYNGMINPLEPFAMRGVIWYQGESNNDRPKQYRTLFPLMIADWRRHWNEDTFPFLFVQIAPYKDMSPEIREAQFLTLKKSPNTAMAVTTDVGDANNIHPANKQPVGARLALAARVLAYGEHIEYSGPLFKSMSVEGNRAIIHFTHVGKGLMAKGGELKGFVVAGTDKKIVPAHAEIQGKTVVVTSDKVSKPVAVRYGWANVPDVNLYNKEGLPASPFRTDVD